MPNGEIALNMSQCTIKATVRLVRPAKTQISLRIRAVWRESSLIVCAYCSIRAIQRGINEPLPYWVDVQVDPSLCWPHRSYCRFLSKSVGAWCSGSVGPTRVQLLLFFCFSISVISCCRVLIVVSSLCSFVFLCSRRCCTDELETLHAD